MLMIFWGLALCQFVQLIRFFSLLWAASSSSFPPPLLHGEGHCSMLPSSRRRDPSTQLLVMHRDQLCCSKAMKTPNYLANTLSPVDDRNIRTVCSLPLLRVQFILQSTDWPDVNWWWRGGRKGHLFFLDRKPVLSSALLILLAQPEFSSCGVWGTSCWTVSLLISLSNSRECFFFISRKSN